MLPPPAGCRRSTFAAGDQVSEGVELLHFDRERIRARTAMA